MANPMQDIYLDKVVINMGLGSSEDKQEAAKALIKKLTGRTAAHTESRKRFPAFGIKKGQIIGVVATLRGEEAHDFLARAIEAAEGKINRKGLANNSVNFGIKEYIYFSGIKYDPKIGMLGLNVNAFFARKGFRVEHRKIKTSKTGKEHKTVTKDELASYLEKNFKVKVVESEA
ncbi:50S ribosomal protein L5 [uncultured archaeon]|nr:50S ribosomal protein L5 [uncultured archaeon]